ncbi:MAG: cation:proton antiporter [Candidatus Micrarchaeota archaeon]|nr:cation:proton antiporter [Candidatus Micrarchaeota archaeon]
MLAVGIVFIFIAGTSFLGFAIDALFSKIKITSVLPLLLIGLVIGPILGLVSTGPQSTITTLAPYVVAVAVSFVLFDVGLNIRFDRLGRIFAPATKFVLPTQVIIGFLISLIAYLGFHWSILYSLIFGFAASGPSSIIVPAFVKNIRASSDLKAGLVYESVLTDIIQLIVPLTLLAFVLNPHVMTLNYLGLFIFTNIVGAMLLGVASAFFWLYVLKKLGSRNGGYSWMLTITMILATYGISQQLGLESAIAIFVFGLVFSNFGGEQLYLRLSGGWVKDYFTIGKAAVKHTKSYQREIVFFVSTFFFVYLGLIFSVQQVSLISIAVALLAVAAVILVRHMTTPLISGMFSQDPSIRRTEASLVRLNIPRGLSSAIIASLPITYGLAVSGFTNTMFLIILFTNIAFSVGVFIAYKDKGDEK